MKIVCISDTHLLHRNLRYMPEGDILIHAGDITMQGSLEAIQGFNNWLGELPYKHKIVIAGNHDWIAEKRPDLMYHFLSNGIYLQDEAVEVEGLKFYGIPWTPRFFDWAFNVDDPFPASRYFNQIPLDTDVLISHGPPYGYLDFVAGERKGCIAHRNRLLDLMEHGRLKLNVFGHLHKNYGMMIHGNTKLVCASVVNEKYKVVNKPIVVEI